MHRPGLGQKEYKCFRKTTTLDETGQPLETIDFEHPVCTFLGTISKAKQSETTKDHQLNHNITHEIIVYHPVPVYAGDILLTGDRLFYVHDIRNPGEINMFYCIMTEERENTGRYEIKS